MRLKALRFQLRLLITVDLKKKKISPLATEPTSNKTKI